MEVTLIAVPYDSGRRDERAGAGPQHLLRAGLGSRLTDAGHHVRTRVLELEQDAWPAEIRAAFDLARAIARAVEDAVALGSFPLVLSGNCGPAALGCVSGLGQAPHVFWFDTHGDFNTPETTVSGFLDGMALATLTGRCWTELAVAIPGFQPVPEAAVALIGARDLDDREAAALAASAVRRVAVGQLRRELPAVLAERADDRPRAYLHLDLDVLDPSEGRVNMFATPGGMSRADLAWAIPSITQSARLEAASLTAFDPSYDTTGTVCEAALALAVLIVDAAGPQRER